VETGAGYSSTSKPVTNLSMHLRMVGSDPILNTLALTFHHIDKRKYFAQQYQGLDCKDESLRARPNGIQLSAAQDDKSNFRGDAEADRGANGADAAIDVERGERRTAHGGG
jgi:hypothetical protein